MKIGILQAGHAPDELINDLGDYHTLFERLLDGHGFSFQTWSVVDMDFPKSPADADGWLITGSRHGAYEDLPFIAPLEQLIRQITATDLPLIGVCFGHQIIAQALGGKVEKYAGGWSVGRTEYTDQNGATFFLNAWHQDQVTKLPEGARSLASSDFCAHAIVAYGDTVWTVQPHPEFGSDMVDGISRTRGKGVVPADLLADAAAKLDYPTDSMAIASDMAQFFLTAQAKNKAPA